MINVQVTYSKTRNKFMLFINNLFKQYVQGEMMSKANFIGKVLNTATSVAQLFDEVPDIEGVYFDRGYNSGGAEPIVQADLDSFGVDLSEFTAMITCIQQLKNFANNAAVTQGDYSSTVNQLRNDI